MRTFDNLFSKINKQIRQMSFMTLRKNLGAKYMDIIDGFELIMNRVTILFFTLFLQCEMSQMQICKVYVHFK